MNVIKYTTAWLHSKVLLSVVQMKSNILYYEHFDGF